MRTKPIIGIIGKVKPKHEEDLWNRIDEVDEIRYLITKNGGIAISLLPTEPTLQVTRINDSKDLTCEELEDLYKQIKLCDGFVLQGGLISCKYEIEIAKKILELDKPLIGICDGFNNILRAIGTNVIKDENNRHNHYDINYRHKINIKKGTLLFEIIGKECLEVNSIHSMIATKEMVEQFATISSLTEDELVESFELSNKKFVIGIKWHPELLLEENYVDRLFKKFIDNC